jgi:U3 small nucleolar RNA-associated protein 12
MVEEYSQYKLDATFGFICSSTTLAFDPTGESIAAGSLENICIWKLQSGKSVKILIFPRIEKTSCSEVTELVYNSKKIQQVVAGYFNGSVRLWDTDCSSCEATFKGHKTCISAMRFDSTGFFLSTGCKNSEIMIWDMTSEIGLYRIPGHSGKITDLVFLTKVNKLVSSSADTFIKVWDFRTQECKQTIIRNNNEVSSIDINQEESRLIAVSSKSEIQIYSISEDFDHTNLKANDCLKFMCSFIRKIIKKVPLISR